ncbi:MAG: hypothetical protein ABI318_18515 [Chthoniobacteraceae bacterium]
MVRSEGTENVRGRCAGKRARMAAAPHSPSGEPASVRRAAHTARPAQELPRTPCAVRRPPARRTAGPIRAVQTFAAGASGPELKAGKADAKAPRDRATAQPRRTAGIIFRRCRAESFSWPAGIPLATRLGSGRRYGLAALAKLRDAGFIEVEGKRIRILGPSWLDEILRHNLGEL